MGSRHAGALRKIIRSVSQADLADVTDRDLLDRFALTADQSAFATLVSRHAAMVLGVCRRGLPTVQDAEDACQATFLVMARKAKSTRWQASVANWLYSTARKVAHNARIAAERRMRREARAAVPEAIPPVDRMTGRELLAALDEQLDKLPPRYRETIVLCYLEGLTQEQAAARLGIPMATLNSRIDRGRKRLHEALTKSGCALGAGLLALAATSPAGASPPRLAESVLAAASGKPPAAVAALAEGVAVNGILNKSALIVLVATVLTVGIAGQWPDQESARAGAPPRATHRDNAEPKRNAAEKPRPKENRDDWIPVTGRVLGPDDKPVAGAKFAVIADETGTPIPEAISGADGKFTLRLSNPRTVLNPRQVVASAPRLGIDWVSEPRADAVFHLVADVPIMGRVIDLQGKPVPGATVAVHNVHAGPVEAFDAMLKSLTKSEQDQEQAAGKLDRSIWNRGGLGQAFHTNTADGTFTLSGLGRDRVVTLLISGPGIADTFADVVTRDGFEATGTLKALPRLYGPKLTVAVEPDKPVTGVIRDEKTSAPLSGIPVLAASLGGKPLRFGPILFHPWPTPATTTDAKGQFTLHGLTKGRAYVLVADPEEGTEHLHRFGYVEDTIGFAPINTSIELPRGVVLKGQVTDAVTGAGVPSRVFYMPLEKNELLDKFPGYGPPDLPAPWHRGRDTKTDFQGRYRISVMPGAGVVNVQAYGTGASGLGYQRASAAQQEIADGIVDKRFGHFRTVGQGGMYNPEFMHAYKVISPAATDRTATLDFKLHLVQKEESKDR